MTDMHERLRQARVRAGFGSAAKAAAALGVGPSMYRGHENGQNRFDADQASHYGKKFGVRAAWLLTGEEPIAESGDSSAPISTARAVLPPPNASPPVPIPYPRDRIPMLGRAAAGSFDDGRFILNGGQVGDALIPPQLLNVPDAYGVFVHGGSMEPRYFPGEAVFVNPHLPIRQDDFVVVQVAGDYEGDDLFGYIKQFRSINSNEIVLRQYAPRTDIEKSVTEDEKFTLRSPRDSLVAVHKIVAAGIV